LASGGRQHADRDSAGGLPKNPHPPGIAAESRDVALHPLESGYLIQQTVVAGMAALFGG
jgi:hypothetical protein